MEASNAGTFCGGNRWRKFRYGNLQSRQNSVGGKSMGGKVTTGRSGLLVSHAKVHVGGGGGSGSSVRGWVAEAAAATVWKWFRQRFAAQLRGVAAAGCGKGT